MNEIIVPYLYNKEKHLNIDAVAVQDTRLTDASVRLFLLIENYINYNYYSQELTYTELSYSQIKKSIRFKTNKTSDALKELSKYEYIQIEDVAYRGLPKKRYYILDTPFTTKENNAISTQMGINTKIDINTESGNNVESDNNTQNGNIISTESGINTLPETSSQTADFDPVQHNKYNTINNNNKLVNVDVHKDKELRTTKDVVVVKDIDKKEEKKEDIISNVIYYKDRLVDLLEYVEWSNKVYKKKIDNAHGFVIAYHREPHKFDLSAYIDYLDREEQKQHKEKQRQQEIILRGKKEEEQKKENIKKDEELEKKIKEYRNKLNDSQKILFDKWMYVRDYFKDNNPTDYELWIKNLRIVKIDTQQVTLKAPDSFSRERVKERYLPVFDNILTDKFASSVVIDVIADDG